MRRRVDANRAGSLVDLLEETVKVLKGMEKADSQGTAGRRAALAKDLLEYIGRIRNGTLSVQDTRNGPVGWLHVVDWVDGQGYPKFIPGPDQPESYLDSLPDKYRAIVSPAVERERFIPLFAGAEVVKGATENESVFANA